MSDRMGLQKVLEHALANYDSTCGCADCEASLDRAVTALEKNLVLNIGDSARGDEFVTLGDIPWRVRERESRQEEK